MSAELEQIAALVAERVADLVDARTIRPLVGVEEAAEALGIPPRWLADRARNGEAPCRRLGHYVRFDVAEVRAWVDATACSGPLTGAGPVTRDAPGQQESAPGADRLAVVPSVVPRRAA